MTSTEVQERTAYADIRYGQCWEDADVLLAGLGSRPGGRLLSVASAGDNSLALLLTDPAEVICVDMSEAQIACLALRVAAMKVLDHEAYLELHGAMPSRRRQALHARVRPHLRTEHRAFWDAREAALVQHGFAAAGRLERYFALFRRHVLPLVHSTTDVASLFEPREASERRRHFERHWNSARWQLMFRIFFSRTVMSLLGRDRAFFDYATGSLADHLAARVAHALCVLDPAVNPYLRWILTGSYGPVLPLALRAEAYGLIRERLDRLTIRQESVEAAADRLADEGRSVDGCNLSNIFEYMAPARMEAVLEQLLRIASPGGRLVYWNMLVPRARPAALSGRLAPLRTLADDLHATDRVFFYRSLQIEQVT